MASILSTDLYDPRIEKTKLGGDSITIANPDGSRKSIDEDGGGLKWNKEFGVYEEIDYGKRGSEIYQKTAQQNPEAVNAFSGINQRDINATLDAGSAVGSAVEAIRGLQSTIDGLNKSSSALGWAGFGVNTALSIYGAIMTAKNYKLAKQNFKFQKQTYLAETAKQTRQYDDKVLRMDAARKGISRNEALALANNQGSLLAKDTSVYREKEKGDEGFMNVNARLV